MNLPSCKPSKMRRCAPSTSGVGEVAARPPSVGADDPSALVSPTSFLPPAVTLLASSLDTCPCMPAGVLYYFSRYCAVRFKMFYFLLVFFNVCVCVKAIINLLVQYSIASCVSWVPQLTLLNLTNWT